MEEKLCIKKEGLLAEELLEKGFPESEPHGKASQRRACGGTPGRSIQTIAISGYWIKPPIILN
jgi:hypothetical protein